MTIERVEEIHKSYGLEEEFEKSKLYFMMKLDDLHEGQVDFLCKFIYMKRRGVYEL